MDLQIFQVDAFTSTPFGGNPAAVVPLTEWLPDESLMDIAAENNLSETAFFVKGDSGYDIRWFTPKVEVNLCGHATLASAYVIFNCLKAEEDGIFFNSHRSGPLGVTRSGDTMTLDFPAYDINEVEQSAELADAVGVIPSRTWETKGNKIMLLLESETEVRELAPDFNALLDIPYDGVIVTAKGDTADFVSRMFAPRIGIPEDPVTGAMHCSLIPYWSEALGKREMFARQVSARGGELFCEMAGDRVKIGGKATLYMKGEIYVASERSVTAGS